jgi:hypothetical protein
LGADRFAGGNGHRGGAGGVGGFRNTGTVILQTVSITGNTGGAGGRGGQGGNAAGCHLLVGPPPFFICGIHAGNGGTGGPGGAGGATNTGVMHTSATITANTGGAGGAGGLGGAGVSESDGCEDGGYGGAGGAGGPGGLYVGDNTLVTGLATGITDNTGGQRGSGGAGATVGCQTKPSGFDGADGASDIRRGAQTLSWTSAPPDSGGPGATFTPTATSTATSVVGQVPVISVEDDCSIDSGTGEVTLTGSVGGSCTVDADEAGNDFFLPATRLSKTVSITDATPPVITPNIVGTPGSNGWYVSDVTLTWTVTDPESVVSGTTGCDEVDITADQASTDYTCEATSAGGTDHTTVSIKRDATAPTLAPSVSPNPVPLGGSATASANATDSGSGVDTASVQCGAVSTSAVGTFTVSCSASDLAGNASGDFSASYTVAAPFGSFLTPLPRSTYSKSGSVIPVKFTLRNATGPLSAAASSALAAHGQVRAILTQAADGSGTKLAAALCGWDATHGNFICTLKSPKMKNVSNPYYVTVQEAGVGSTTWFNAPSVSGASGAAVNPVQIGFK